jgi:hypothetical protein
MLANVQMVLKDMSDRLEKVEKVGMTLFLIIMMYVE